MAIVEPEVVIPTHHLSFEESSVKREEGFLLCSPRFRGILFDDALHTLPVSFYLVLADGGLSAFAENPA